MSIPTFTPGIPNTGQSLGSTKDAVRNNFGNYAGVIAVNHVAPNNTGQGKHTFCEFVAQASDPTTAVGEITLYGKAVSGSTELFVRKDSNGSVYQLTTGVPVLAGSNGSTFLPGGIILKWININVTANPLTVNFIAQGVGNFPNNFLAGSITPNVNNPNTSATLNAASTSQIDIYTTRIGVTHFLIMIGN